MAEKVRAVSDYQGTSSSRSYTDVQALGERSRVTLIVSYIFSYEKRLLTSACHHRKSHPFMEPPVSYHTVLFIEKQLS